MMSAASLGASRSIQNASHIDWESESGRLMRPDFYRSWRFQLTLGEALTCIEILIESVSVVVPLSLIIWLISNPSPGVRTSLETITLSGVPCDVTCLGLAIYKLWSSKYSNTIASGLLIAWFVERIVFVANIFVDWKQILRTAESTTVALVIVTLNHHTAKQMQALDRRD